MSKIKFFFYFILKILIYLFLERDRVIMNGGGVEREGQGDFALSTEPNTRLYPRPLIMT